MPCLVRISPKLGFFKVRKFLVLHIIHKEKFKHFKDFQQNLGFSSVFTTFIIVPTKKNFQINWVFATNSYFSNNYIFKTLDSSNMNSVRSNNLSLRYHIPKI